MSVKKAINRMPPFDEEKGCLNVIVETPKGSRVKYAFDPRTGLLELRRPLPEGMLFPFNFGFVPSTRAPDGDPLDILILNEEPIVSGCLLKVRAIALLKAEQTEDKETTRNDRIIGLAIGKQTPTDMETVHLDIRMMQQIEYFFVSYNKLDGKKFKVLATEGPKKAKDLVRKAAKEFKKSKQT